MRENATSSEGVNQKGKRIFYGDAIDTLARWAGEEGFGPRGKGGRRG
jgi:hypothetical protein